MKNILMILSITCKTTFGFAQTPPTPIPGSYTVPTTANLCSLNQGFEIRNLNLSPINYQSGFTINLQLFVVNSNTPPFNYPWSSNVFPDCYSQLGGSGSYPIGLSNCTLSPQCFLLGNQQPTWSSNSQSFEWNITSCNASSIELIEYSVYLDCSIFSSLFPGGALHLIQVWSYNNIPFSIQPNPVPITFPNLIAPAIVTFNGNYNPGGPAEEWLFAYQNTGTGPADIFFTFSIDQCPSEYDITTNGISFTNSNTPIPQSPNWINYPVNNHIVIPVGEFLVIRQQAVILGCPPECQPVPKAHFNWRCNNLDILGNPYCVSSCCSFCYNNELISEIYFNPEIPTFTITRNTPIDVVALHNPACQGTTTPWSFTVLNTSTFTELPFINITFSNGYSNSLSIISEASIQTPSCNNCSTAIVPLVYPQEVTPCSTNVADPVSEFTITLTDIPPGGFATIQFDEFHCCSNDPDFFDIRPKFFNQWQLTAQCTTVCNTALHPDYANSNFLVNQSGNGISGYGSNPLTDIELTNSPFAGHPHTVVAQTQPPQPAPYYGQIPLEYEVNFTGMFGNQDDEQALGFSPANNEPIEGIIRVEIAILNNGLLLANPNHAFFEITDPQNPGVINWHHFQYFSPNYPCTNFIANEPCTTAVECSTYTYCLYYRISDVLNSFPNNELFYPAGSQRTKFKFTFYSCCFADGETNFQVSFSLLRNSDDCQTANISNCNPVDCFLPLGRISDNTVVHCPGCLAPGVIVDHYRLERTTLGYPDITNDRAADSQIAIPYTTGLQTSNYNEYNEVELNQSVFGDRLVDYAIAHFEDGFYQCPGFPGYDYGMMLNSGIELNNLQLLRTFPFSGSNDFDVQVTGFDFYIDEGSPPGTCIDGPLFYENPNSIQRPTIFNMTVDFATATPTTIAMFFERGLSPNDDMLLFTFTEDELNNLIQNGTPTGVTINVNGISSVDFLPWQVYRLRTRYRVCGNFHDPLPNPPTPLAYWSRTSNIMNYMYLKGEVVDVNYFITNNVVPNDNGEQMPDDLFDIYNNLGIELNGPPDPACACNTNPPCAPATQANLGDPFFYICEPSGDRHLFFSTDLNNYTGYISRVMDGNECLYYVEVYAGNTFSKTSGSNSGQLFKFEFKPPAIFPSEIQIVTLPAGWEFVNNNGVIPVEIRYVTPQFTFSAPSNVNIQGTANSISIDLTNLPLQPANPAFDCIFDNTVVSASPPWLIGDEYNRYRFRIDCRPSTGCPLTDSQQADSTHSIVHFTHSQEPCSPHTPSCSFTGQQNNNPLFAPESFFHAHSPNLQAQIIPQSFSATSNQVTWSFTITNNSIAVPLFQPTTAKNVFIQVPQINGFSNWTANYSINGNLPYPWAPNTYTTVNVSGLNPNNGYFWLVPDPQPVFNYLTQDGFITGTITADYHPCLNTPPPADVQFHWGWNCTQNISVTPNCVNEPSDHELTNSNAALVADPIHSLFSPASYTACGSAIHVRACFKSTEPGEVLPQQASILPNGNITIANLGIVPCTSGSNTTYSIDPNGAITITSGNGYMQNGDCFCLEFDVIPHCNFGPLQLPTVQIEWKNFCGDDEITLYDLPEVPVNIGQPSQCTDCYSITKTSSATSISNGTEQVTFTIEVCGNNDPTSLPWATVDLTDVYPPGFTVIGNDPFANQPIQLTLAPANPCTTFTVTGTITTTTIPANVCNEAQIQIGTNGSTLTAEACVDIVNNCINTATNYSINNQTATQVFGAFCTSSPCIVSNQVIDITGTFTINDDFVFNDCVFTMEPGSEIIILTTTTFTRCDLGNCFKMWKGITLSNNAVAALRSSTVHGAQYGIEVNDRNVLVVRGSDFYDNYIGIFMPDLVNASLSTFNTSAVSVSSSRFYGTGSMPPVFQWQTDYLGYSTGNLPDLPYSGILTYRATSLFLGFSTTQPNKFYNMSNGIIGQRSNLSGIFNCRFEDIMPEPGYNYASQTASFNANYNGSAIYGNGYKTAFEIEQEGFGTATTDPATFTNCRYGIFADRIQLHSQNNKMVNMGTAYHARHIKSSVVIHSNNIDSHFDAIQLKDCDGSQQTTVWNNDILFGDNDATKQYAAIRVEESQIYNPNSFIHYNRINFRQGAISARTGIHTNATTNFFITQNEITMTDNNYNHDGIFMTGCIKNNVSCNEVTGSLASDQPDYQSAITNEMGDSPIIGCNIVDQTNNGIFILGNVTGWSFLQGNEMNMHNYGWRYSVTGLTDNQNFRGNRWMQSALSGIQAKHDDQSIFTNIHFNLVNPVTANLFPSHSPPNWFQPAGGTNFECTTGGSNNGDYCADFPPDCPNCHTRLDELIAKDSIINNPFTEETKWMMKDGLYGKLYENNDMLSDSLMNAFYLNMQNTFIAEMKPLKDEKAGLFVTDSILNNLIEQEKTAFIILWDSMKTQARLLDSALATNDTSAFYSIVNGIDLLNTEMEIVISETDSLHEIIFSERNSKAESTETGFSQLVSTNILEENEQTVSRIYLSSIARDIYEFTPEQAETIRSIAYQCPVAGGNAVFRARTLYSLINEYARFNDMEICNLQGIALRQFANSEEKDKRPFAKLYPNPANEAATLVYELPENIKGEFSIFSTTGQRWQMKELSGGRSEYQFSTKALLPGVYYYSLKAGGVPVTFGKLVIIR